jgi:hypothetical protein
MQAAQGNEQAGLENSDIHRNQTDGVLKRAGNPKYTCSSFVTFNKTLLWCSDISPPLFYIVYKTK